MQWGDKKASKEEVQLAASHAQADKFIEHFKEGYHTELGQGGANVSGGQKQRLCIARAVLKKSPILLFDEATSALDEWTEKQLLINIEKLGKTCILITHRALHKRGIVS